MRQQRLQNTRICLRLADISDAERIWMWRNDPETRRQSFCSAPIPWESHLDWFQRKIHDADEAFLIAEIPGGCLHAGYVRFSLLGKEWAEVGIVVDPFIRRQGYGKCILQSALRWAAQNLPADHVLAQIKQSNTASLALFRKTGFRTNGMADPGQNVVKMDFGLKSNWHPEQMTDHALMEPII